MTDSSNDSVQWQQWRFPHHASCFLCGDPGPGTLGLRIEMSGNVARTAWLVAEREQGPAGWGHGGMLAAILDELMAYAIIPIWPGHVTKEFTIRFLRPTAVGMVLQCIADAEKFERHIEATGRITLPSGELAAEAKAIWVQPRTGVVSHGQLPQEAAPK